MTQPINDDQPSIVLNQLVIESGIYPSSGNTSGGVPIGFIRTFANTNRTPIAANDQQEAQGQILPINNNTELFAVIRTTYGGDGQHNFALPDLAGRVAVGSGGAGPSLGQSYGQDAVSLTSFNMPVNGGDQPFDNDQPSLGVTYMINVGGAYGNGETENALGMVLPFLGTSTPGGYLPADGQLLNIQDYTALFSIIGTSYGGNGQTDFALPNLQGRDVVGAGTGPSGASYTPSETFGGDITLNTSEVVNDQPPTVTIGASGYSVAEQQPLILKGTGLSVADADGGNGVETLTLKVSEGTLNVYPLNTGVTVQSGNNSSELVLTGTITQLQDLLGPPGSSLSGAGSNLSYEDDINTPTSVALTLSLDDNGFTGLNGPLTAMASTTIDVTPCYCAGTLIETENGEVPVDMLKIGELIRTASGTLRPIRWIGRRSYSGRYIIGRKDILPICIKAGALDENVPRRDLWISP